MDADDRVYRFGPFQADVRRCALFRDAESVPLSQKAFEVLQVLLEHRGEMVSRDRLMELLWPDRIVEEANLTQTVFVLRKALGDDPDAPRYIHTVPRRGYRFIAPVDELAGDGDFSAMSDERAESVAGDAGGSSPRASRIKLKVAGVFMLLAAAIVLTLWLSPWARVAHEVQAPVRLTILPFATTGSDSELRLLAVSMNDLLITRLGAQPGLLLVGQPAGLWSASTPAAMGAFAREARLKYLLGGNLRRGANPHWARLSITRYDVDESGGLRAIPLQSYDIPFLGDGSAMERFVSIRNRIAEDLLQQLEPTVKPGLHREMSSATTPHNAEAYRLYLLALHDVRTASCSGPQAVARLQSSLELDPGFAPAWVALGWAQYNLVSFCGQPASHYTEALRSADHALALAPKFARSIALKAAVLIETGKEEEAYALLMEARRDLPWQPDIEYMTVYVLRYAGYLDRAAKNLDTLLARDPVYLGVEGWTPNTLLYQGRLADFLDRLPEGDSPVFLYYRGFAEMLQDRKREAQRALRPAFTHDPNDVFARLSEALMAILAGDKSTAVARLDGLVLDRKRLGLDDGEITYKIAQLFALAERDDAALDQLDQAIEQGFFNLPYLQSDPVFASLRKNLRFKAIVDKARIRHEAFGRRFELVQPSRPPSSATATEDT
ncbi:MAG: winged helix-turn-helix domain-containing protein [Gammaproteobacteria bacterium]